MDLLGGLASLALGAAVMSSATGPRHCGGVSFGYGGRHGYGGHGAFYQGVGHNHNRHGGYTSMSALQSFFGGAPCRRIYGRYNTRPPPHQPMVTSSTVIYNQQPQQYYSPQSAPQYGQMVQPAPVMSMGPYSNPFANQQGQPMPAPNSTQQHQNQPQQQYPPYVAAAPTPYYGGGPAPAGGPPSQGYQYYQQAPPMSQPYPYGASSGFGRQVVDPNALVYRGGARPIKPFEFPTPYTQGKCRGLFIGINYYNTPAELRGCCNDVAVILDTLKQLQFPLEEAAILVDDPNFAGASGLPTRDNIIQHMLWLVKDAKAGDVLFFHFSGHGSQTRDLDGDEADGMDETLVPVDFKTAGMIVDDDIFELMVRNLPSGVRMTAIMDCCHSGSLMDLPFSYVSNGDLSPRRNTMTAKRGHHMRMSAGEVVMFSGCGDDQKSADLSNTSSGFQGNSSYGAGGACTNALSMVLTRTSGLSYMQLIEEMRKVLVSRGFKQMPELSTSKPMDLNAPFSFFGGIRTATQFTMDPGRGQPKLVVPYQAFIPAVQQQQQQVTAGYPQQQQQLQPNAGYPAAAPAPILAGRRQGQTPYNYAVL